MKKDSLKPWFFQFNSFLWASRELILRLLFTWSIGLCALFFTMDHNYDHRFRWRGPKPLDSRLAIVSVSPSDLSEFFKEDRQFLRRYGERAGHIDSPERFKSLLGSVLKSLLSANPRAIALPAVFGRSSKEWGRQTFGEYADKLFWGQSLHQTVSIQPTAPGEVQTFWAPPDSDGFVRSYQVADEEQNDWAMALAQRLSPDKLSAHPQNKRAINFQGAPRHRITLSDWLRRDHPSTYQLKDKIVFISFETMQPSLLTAQGPMYAMPLLAVVVDNWIQNRWIYKSSFWAYGLYLLLFMLITLAIVSRYPISAAFVFTIWLGIAASAASAWAFDSQYYWLPVLAPLFLMALTFLILVSYQLTTQEKINWRLAHEAKSHQELELLKNNFISLFSHDLKTPMAKMQAIIDRSLARSVPDEMQEDLIALRQSNKELHNYIEKILQLTRVESRKIKINKEVADINEIVQVSVEALKPLAVSKGIQLEVIEEPLFTIDADSQLIQEVLINLIDNAIKYTPSGGKVTVTSKEVDNYVAVTVTDTGDGISKEEQKHIWRKFVRGKQHDHSTKGSGLGLYLSRYFIELHDGSISLTSEEGQGTTIEFRLPIEASEVV